MDNAIYVIFLENPESFLTEADQGFSVEVTIRKRNLTFPKSMFFYQEKNVRIIWLPIWTEFAIVIYYGKLLSTKNQRNFFFPYFFFQEILSCEYISIFNSTLNQICSFFFSPPPRQCEILWGRAAPFEDCYIL